MLSLPKRKQIVTRACKGCLKKVIFSMIGYHHNDIKSKSNKWCYWWLITPIMRYFQSWSQFKLFWIISKLLLFFRHPIARCIWRKFHRMIILALFHQESPDGLKFQDIKSRKLHAQMLCFSFLDGIAYL